MIKFRFDMSRLERSIRDLRPLVNKTKAQLVEQAAKGFVKTVVAVTPPASKGKTGAKAKAQGEAAIKGDLAKIMAAAARKRDLDTRSGAASPEELYRRFRDKHTGRINPKGLRQPYRVPKAALAALQRRLLAEVGWLAAGWNQAARKLGVRLPAWVNRHGTGQGSVDVTRSGSRFRITVANEVRFVGNVKGFRGRIQAAINYQANAMRRQAEYLMKKAMRKAGWKA